MIECIKGFLLKGNRLNDNSDQVMSTLLLTYRDRQIQINNLEKKSDDPYMGAILTKVKAEELLNFLQEAIASSEKNCDKCYDYQLPKFVSIVGDIICKNCGNIIKRNNEEY